VLEKYPGLKIITHHCGGLIPYLAARIASIFGNEAGPPQIEAMKNLRPGKPVSEYFRMFYTDTALYGNTPGLMCGQAFFGTGHLLFGSDMPYVGQVGDEVLAAALNAVNRMEISDSDKKQIFEGNATKILNLPV
jgi:uncharacterized protein